ncbi:MAG: hypothetical protein H7A46_09940 [Verrucomicrobiales bacterium]|nr:hypothetical protein [Verrucomicrobiales bacterium]
MKSNATSPTNLPGPALIGPLPIPEIPERAELPVRVLARAAYVFRGLVVQMAEGRTLKEICQEHGHGLLVLERVVDVWAEHFGILEEHNAEMNPED